MQGAVAGFAMLLSGVLLCLLLLLGTRTSLQSAGVTGRLPEAPRPAHAGPPAAAPLGGPCSCPVGNVSDCRCTFAELDRANAEQVHEVLKLVVATPFFAHFKLDLCSECRLWQDSPQCNLRDCSVCECEDPPLWAAAVPAACADESELSMESTRVTATDSQSSGWEDGAATSPWSGFLGATSNTDADERSQGQGVVVDLRENPERYTGYAGESAAKVWHAVHAENCFQLEDGLPALTPEQRLYNRIISGLHSSISLHIANDYCLERRPEARHECAQWGPNLHEARERVLQHPDRVENLYAAYALLLRAVVRAGDAVAAAVPPGGADAEIAASLQEWQQSLLPEVRRLATSTPLAFQESDFFHGTDAEAQRAELQKRLQHLQEVMRCVGCDRCKLWGTLQALGVSTALRVLFPSTPLANSSSSVTAAPPSPPVELTRQEAVALVHTLERFSSSLAYAHELRAMSRAAAAAAAAAAQ